MFSSFDPVAETFSPYHSPYRCNKMDSNNTILRNLEDHLNVSGADAFAKLAEIPQYLLEDQLILASAHLFVKNIASIYMRWLFLQPLSDVEGHQVAGSFTPFMKVRGLGVNEVLEMWKQESKSALKFARGDTERETRMRMRINRLRREIESEYFKWHNAANQSSEASSLRRPGNLGDYVSSFSKHGGSLTSGSIAELADETYSVRVHRGLLAVGSDQKSGVKVSDIENDTTDAGRSDAEGSSSSEETQEWRRPRERTARDIGRFGKDAGRLGRKVVSEKSKGSYRPYNSNTF